MRPRIVFELALSTWLLFQILGCAHPQTRNPTVPPGAGPPADVGYRGTPQIQGSKSQSEYFREYPPRIPGASLVARMAEILADHGHNLHLSTTSVLEHFLSDNLEIETWVRTPPSCLNTLCPVIVEVYGDGGCYSSGYDWRAEPLLQAGFIVVKRTHGE